MDSQRVSIRGPAMPLELKKIMGLLFRESSVQVLGYSRREREPDPARTSSIQTSFALLELNLSSRSGVGRNNPRNGLNRTLSSLPEVQTYRLSFQLSQST
jgi:hypothetical protein